MRIHACGALGLFAIAIAAVGAAHAQPRDGEAIEVVLEPPARLSVGDRAEVIAVVRLGSRAGTPLLVTPSSEGSAVEVVRGRLLRGDAEGPSASTLRFRVPIVARTAGTAVLRVRVDGFECVEGRCRALVVEASVPIDVLPAAAPAR